MSSKAERGLVSVIVPVYNAGKYLEKCIQSILCQTCRDFELLLVNDGSKDNSGAICEEYRKKDSRIKVLHKGNQGVSSARNEGLKRCRGEYVAFVDSDDYVKENYLECLLTGLQEHGADISICNYWFKEENKMSPACRLESCLVASNSHMNYCKYGLLLITVWGKLFKRDVIYNIFFDTAISFGEDSLFVAQALKNASRIFFKSDTLYVYRISKSFGKYGIGGMEEAVSVWDKIARMQEPESDVVSF